MVLSKQNCKKKKKKTILVKSKINKPVWRTKCCIYTIFTFIKYKYKYWNII